MKERELVAVSIESYLSEHKVDSIEKVQSIVDLEVYVEKACKKKYPNMSFTEIHKLVAEYSLRK